MIGTAEAEDFLQTNGLTADSVQAAFSEFMRVDRVFRGSDNLTAAIDSAEQRALEQRQNIDALAPRVRADFLERARTELEERCRTLEEQYGIAGVQQFLEALEGRVKAESDGVLNQLNGQSSSNLSWDSLREQARQSPTLLQRFTGFITQRSANDQRLQQLKDQAKNHLRQTTNSAIAEKTRQILDADTDSIRAVVQEKRRQHGDETQQTQEIVQAIRERLERDRGRTTCGHNLSVGTARLSQASLQAVLRCPQERIQSPSKGLRVWQHGQCKLYRHKREVSVVCGRRHARAAQSPR
jgi:hypothetical protein